MVFRIAMRTRLRGQTVREGVLLHGPAGWGEFSPFPGYGPRGCATAKVQVAEYGQTSDEQPCASAVETSVGPAAGLAPAAALSALPCACGPGTMLPCAGGPGTMLPCACEPGMMSLLPGDVVADPPAPVDGRLTVRRPRVDVQQLSAYEIESPQWLRRMQEASL
ncbi:hypothetical protein FXF51_00355 [Nonomuraea sp. PA05]|nr:hypothetical protein [Nonomuraea sp. PA05]TYB70932.1 hypothetical protein FXF51_00355 [Nonomuraea sp. PA05]